MQGKREIWVLTTQQHTGERIKDLFLSARMLNPVQVFGSSADLLKAVRQQTKNAGVLLLDLAAPEEFRREMLSIISEYNLQQWVIALVDDESERLLDQAYEAGVKSYLARDFSFMDFLERARFLELQFILDRNEKH